MSTGTTRICDSCRASASADSIKCPHCGDWRRDVKTDRNLCYLWSLISAVPILTFAFGIGIGWWPPPRGSGGSLAQVLFAPMFSTWTFITSPSGLALLLSTIVSMILAIRYYVAYSQKTGSWFWV